MTGLDIPECTPAVTHALVHTITNGADQTDTVDSLGLDKATIGTILGTSNETDTNGVVPLASD